MAWHSLTGIIKENHSFWKKSLSPNTQKDENTLERWETLFQRKSLILPAGEKAHFIWTWEHHRRKQYYKFENILNEQ